MTPQEELKNYINFWQQKGQSKADLSTLLRSEAEALEVVSDVVEEAETSPEITENTEPVTGSGDQEQTAE